MKQSSTIISVIALLSIFVLVMFITMTATTEAEEGFRLSPEEQQVEVNYYKACPFKKAELDDLTAQQSIRQYVEFQDVYCDEEQKMERVVVKLIGNDKEVSKQQFENWLVQQDLKTTDKLQIILQ